MLISVLNVIFCKNIQFPILLVLKGTVSRVMITAAFYIRKQIAKLFHKMYSSPIEDVNKIINMYLRAEVFIGTHTQFRPVLFSLRRQVHGSLLVFK